MIGIQSARIPIARAETNVSTPGGAYILCPDNAVDRATDERRIRWAVDDIIRNRPALSRWHPEFEAAFARYMEDGES